MTTIWKYPLQVTDQQEVRLPRHAQILTCQMQEGIPTLWALVDPEEDKVRAVFYMVGTGNLIPEGGVSGVSYINSVQQGMFVWHIFRQGSNE